MLSTMNWKDPATQYKLLLAILASNEGDALSGAKATQIATYMGCTPKAVSHQLTALRQEIKKLKDGDFVSAPATPGTAKASASGKKRKGAAEIEERGDGEGDETPSKKGRTVAKGKKGGKKEGVTANKDEGDEIAARKAAAEGKTDEEI